MATIHKRVVTLRLGREKGNVLDYQYLNLTNLDSKSVEGNIRSFFEAYVQGNEKTVISLGLFNRTDCSVLDFVDKTDIAESVIGEFKVYGIPSVIAAVQEYIETGDVADTTIFSKAV